MADGGYRSVLPRFGARLQRPASRQAEGTVTASAPAPVATTPPVDAASSGGPRPDSAAVAAAVAPAPAAERPRLRFFVPTPAPVLRSEPLPDAEDVAAPPPPEEPAAAAVETASVVPAAGAPRPALNPPRRGTAETKEARAPLHAPVSPAQAAAAARVARARVLTSAGRTGGGGAASASSPAATAPTTDLSAARHSRTAFVHSRRAVRLAEATAASPAAAAAAAKQADDDDGSDDDADAAAGRTPPAQQQRARWHAADESPASGSCSPDKRREKAVFVVDLSNSRYPVVKKAAVAAGWKIHKPEKEGAAAAAGSPTGTRTSAAPNVYWTDVSVSVEKASRVAQMGCKINHFPSMDGIGRKVPLVTNMNRMSRRFPEEYGKLMPRAFTEFSDFSKHRQSLVQYTLKNPRAPKPYYIVKPNSGCMGKGIYLTSNPQPEAFEQAVVQEYVSDPLLIEGRKFDIRCYVLVLSVCPPRIFFYQDGLVRLCAEPFQAVDDENIKTKCMHLTNYAVNKHHSDFRVGNGTTGGKRDFAFFSSWLDDHGHDSAKFWSSVHDLAVKTVFAHIQPLATSYQTAAAGAATDDGFSCFELLGFDVLVDAALNPLLCEVNHSPSLTTDTAFDAKLKLAVLTESFKLVALANPARPRPLTSARAGRAGAAEAASGATADEVSLLSSLGLFGAHRKHLKRRQHVEDKALAGYTRVYPAADPERQRMYRDLMAGSVGQQDERAGARRPASRGGTAASSSSTATAAAHATSRTRGFSAAPAASRPRVPSPVVGARRRPAAAATAAVVTRPKMRRSHSAAAGAAAVSTMMAAAAAAAAGGDAAYQYPSSPPRGSSKRAGLEALSRRRRSSEDDGGSGEVVFRAAAEERKPAAAAAAAAQKPSHLSLAAASKVYGARLGQQQQQPRLRLEF